MGLVIAWFNYKDIKVPQMFANPSYLVGIGALAILAFVLIQVPLKNAGHSGRSATARQLSCKDSGSQPSHV